MKQFLARSSRLFHCWEDKLREVPLVFSVVHVYAQDLASYHLHTCTHMPEEVRQEAGPDVIWKLAHGAICMADASWSHSFRVWTLQCLYLGLDHAYLYLRLCLRDTVRCLLAYCLVNPKNWSLWWKLGGTVVKKPQVWSPLGLYRHVIISFMTFWPCQTSSAHTHPMCRPLNQMVRSPLYRSWWNKLSYNW